MIKLLLVLGHRQIQNKISVDGVGGDLKKD